MATPTLRPPVDSEVFIKESANSRPWLNFFRQVARMLAGLLGNAASTATISTTDVTAAAAITQNPIAAATIPSIADPMISSAAAGGTYTAAEQTLINEIRSDLNVLSNQYFPPARTMMNELKSDVNALTVELNDTRTQLNLAIALVNELKAEHNQLVSDYNALIASISIE